MSTKQFTIPGTITSEQEVMQLLQEVKLYGKWFSHEAILRRISGKKGTVPPALSDTTRQVINDWNDLFPITNRSLDSLMTTLEKIIRSADTVTMTLAAPATHEVKKSLTTWCRLNMSPNVFVSFQFNSTLLGGMVIRHGSHVYDWSLRRQLLASGQEFAKVLRHVR